MKGHKYYPNVPWILKDVISAQVCKCTLWRTEVTVLFSNVGLTQVDELNSLIAAVGNDLLSCSLRQ